MTEAVVDPFVRGLAVGFAIAAAIGPIGLLAIRRTLDGGAGLGLATGLGAATADGIYAAIAAFGLSAVSDFLVAQRRPLGVAGGLALVGLAALDLRRARGPGSGAGQPVAVPSNTVPPRNGPSRTLPSRAAPVYASTVALTLANPATILSFAAAFVGLGLLGSGGPRAAALVAGVAAGSAAWWCALVGVVATLRLRIGPRGVVRLAVASSALIGLLGLVAIAWAITGTD